MRWRILTKGGALLLLAWATLPACGARSSLDLPLGVTRDGAGGAGGGATTGTSGAGETSGIRRSRSDASGGRSGATSNQSGTQRGSSGDTHDSGGTHTGSDDGGATTRGGSSGCGDTSPLPPSCAPGGPGMTNCGPCNESCCRSVEVIAGDFDRTYTNDGHGPTGAADPASISKLRIDKYLVTVGRFRQFVRAWNGGSGYEPAAGSGKHAHLHGGQGLAVQAAPGTYEPGWSVGDDSWIDPTEENLSGCPDTTWTSSPGANENLPMNCVDWWEAYAFCIWDDAFLPSEAEWGYAAAGGGEQREYPWGEAAPGKDNAYAIFGYGTGNPAKMGCYYPAEGRCTGVANIAPVGTAKAGAGRWSQLDLAGDVGEWVLDWFGPYVSPSDDAAALEEMSLRVIRGGGYHDSASYLSPSVRDGRYPPGRNGDVGIRCARVP